MFFDFGFGTLLKNDKNSTGNKGKNAEKAFFQASLNFLGCRVPHYFFLHVQSQRGDWITPPNSQQKFPH